MLVAVIAILQYVVGNAIASQIIEIIGFSWTMVFGESFVVFSCIYCLAFVKNIIPKKLDATTQTGPATTVKKSSFADVVQLLKDIYVTYARKREGNSRIYILLITISFFFYVTVDQGVDNTTALYRNYANSKRQNTQYLYISKKFLVFLNILYFVQNFNLRNFT